MTDLRSRVLDAASRLLAEGGPSVVSTRAVSAAAGVHAPALYRLFGDKNELMDAVAAHALDGYLASKTAMERSPDPVENLRRGFVLHVGFGLENPDAYAAIFASRRTGPPSEAEERAETILRRLIHAIAEAGLLAVPEDDAVRLVHTVGRGSIFTLTPEDDVDAHVERAFGMLCGTIIRAGGPVADDPIAGAATTLRASLDDLAVLSPAERALMGEWLARVERG